MRSLFSFTLASLLFFAGTAWAADAASTPVSGGPAMTASADMSEGEVRKIDMETKKITLRHGEIKNLGMPGMTMVFQVKDPAMLDKVKAGDKVRFSAEKLNGALVVTNIEAVR